MRLTHGYMDEYFESESYLKVEFQVDRLNIEYGDPTSEFGWTYKTFKYVREWHNTKQGVKTNGIQTYTNFFNAPPSTYYSLQISGDSSVYNKSNGMLIRDENGERTHSSDLIWLHFR